jgi:hypothetical protein
LIETGVEKVTPDLRPHVVEGFVIGAIAGAAVGATGIIYSEKWLLSSACCIGFAYCDSLWSLKCELSTGMFFPSK